MTRRAGLWIVLSAVAAGAVLPFGSLLAQQKGDPFGAGGSAGADPFAVPAKATPAQLIEFMQEVAALRIRTTAEMKKQAIAIEQASTAILAQKSDEETAALAVRAKLSAYEGLESLGDESAATKKARFLQSLKGDPRPMVVLVLAEEGLKARANAAGEATAAERRKLVDDALEHMRQLGPGGDALRIALTLVDPLEAVDPAEAANAYDRFGAFLAKSKEEEVREHIEPFAGIARRLRLPGNPIEIEGTTVDGRPFTMKKFEGKVVLVDFWATWCGPCVAELPEVKKLYDRYHAKGFEVVGISLDQSKEDLEGFLKQKPLPWPILFHPQENAGGWGHPMAARYGIQGIPTAILVDQKGKVIELSARGEKLAKLLEQLLGPTREARGEAGSTRRE